MGNQQLKTVQDFDIKKWTGTWYVIAMVENIFNKGLEDPINTIKIVDEKAKKLEFLFQGTKKGKKQDMTLELECIGNGKFKAGPKTVFIPKSEIYVLQVGENYQYWVGGNPGRDRMSIQCRKPKMQQQQYKSIVKKLKQGGFKVENLIKKR